MEGKYYALIELVFSGLVVIGFCVWQLVSVNREIAKDKKGSPERPGHPVGEHRLDDR